jgi:predicted GNAT family N-acyltransferase
MKVRKAGPDEFQRCLAVRREVFVEEQDVLWEEEVDGLDPECVHFLALTKDDAVGTGRLRFTPEGEAKPERIAVRSSWRNRGVGRALMEAIEAEAERSGRRELLLSAQVRVIPFYERLGYRAEGPEFLEARIPHRMMRKRLDRG